ncbi:hypothetical protein KC19_6G101800 [Ceratodon purpureus]|uniref:Uncharacterized protein n=1 Tax=Ceratodon purpureus TaxID=3225 RepID=A0A8T0HIN3_CERPU|nr:hypothetical protein KC19_6G101800 [Ceratodon purpureus]
MASIVRLNTGRLVQTLTRQGGSSWLRCRAEATLMNSRASVQEAANAIRTRCAPLHHAASHPCSSVQTSQCSETKTPEVFMSTNSKVSPPTVSTREKVPVRKDSGSQAVERKEEREKPADRNKKLDESVKTLPSAKDEDLVP